LECWDVADLVEPKLKSGEAWETSFENAWQAPILGRILDVHPFPLVHYLLHEVSLASSATIPAYAAELDGLIRSLLAHPEVICAYNLGRSGRTVAAAEVVEALRAGSASRCVDEDKYATLLDAFSAFLASQRAALQQARESNCALLHVQFKG
jgi:hypothetical protein